MPKVLEDRVKAIMRSGVSKSRAYAIATAALQKEGKLPKTKKRPAKKRTK